LKLVYFAFPYTEDPINCCKEIQTKVQHILDVSEDIVPLVPHFMFDALYDFPHGNTHVEFLEYEVELISRCDIFCYDPERVSVGVAWELAIAKKFGVKVMSYIDLTREVSE